MKNNFLLICSVALLMALAGCLGSEKGVTKKEAGETGTGGVQQYLQSGREFENRGDLAEALQQYKLALEADPGNAEANSEITRIENKMQSIAEKHYQEGLKLHRKGKYEEARRAFLTALRYWPDHPEAWKMVRPPKTASEVREYITHTIQTGQSLSKLAILYYGDYKKFPTIAAFNHMDDATQVTVGQMIKVPEIDGTPLEALKQTQRALAAESAPTQPAPVKREVKATPTPLPISTLPKPQQEPVDRLAEHRNAGMTEYKNGNYKAAIGELNLVLNEDPKDPIALDYLSRAYFKLGEGFYGSSDFDSAARAFEAALSYDADCAACREYLTKINAPAAPSSMEQAVALFEGAEYDAAIDAFSKYLDANPGDSKALNFLSRSHLAKAERLYVKKAYLPARDEFKLALDYDETCDKCREYIQQSELTYCDTHYSAGISLFGKEKLAEAIREWELVEAIDPNYKNVANNLKKARTLQERLEFIKKKQQSQ